MNQHKLILVFFGVVLSHALFSWQDDAALFLRNPLERFVAKEGVAFLPSARSEVRLGRYVEGDNNHSWRGAVDGDVGLLSFSPHLLWHWGLNMETLADGNNAINFRLVQVYYQSLTGISWHLGPGAWSLALNHRCSHGADSAVRSRILIRSGLHSSYEMPFSYRKMHFLLRGALDAYLWGQNADLAHQSRGQALLALQMMWPIRGAWSMLIASSFGEELIAKGHSNAFFINAKAQDVSLRPVGGVRLGMRISSEMLTNDLSLTFSHIPDTGFGARAQAHNGLSFDISFYW